MDHTQHKKRYHQPTAKKIDLDGFQMEGHLLLYHHVPLEEDGAQGQFHLI